MDARQEKGLQIAATTNDVLNGIQPVLPDRDLLVFASPMFQKEETSIRLEDPTNFS